jgi:ABC-type multidrug transport system permease subunit
MSERRSFRDSALWHLTRMRIVGFLREPEAVFWVFAFPVVMALALGVAFRNQGPQKSKVGVEPGAHAAATVAAISASADLEAVTLAAGEGRNALRRGRIAVLIEPSDAGASPSIAYDPTRPETRFAFVATRDALERAAGRVDRLTPRVDTETRPGSRYIDFLIPGLLGLNLLGTGFWGVGFPIATMRQQKLLKRLVATPMRRGDFLLSLMLARLVWLVLEAAAVLGFGMIAFGIAVRGSWLALIVVTLAGTFAFSALGLFVVSRARTIEAVSGLMNFAMVPMWLLSGSFFSADRFPAFMQPFVQALPLTVVNNALRAIMNDGAGMAAMTTPILILVAWTVISFGLALKLFRWD